MAQINPVFRPNSVRVIDCVEWLLQQISPSNSDGTRPYYTDGVIVDRRRDPRKVYQDLKSGYQSVGTLVRIKEGSGKLLSGTKGYVGNSKRQQASIELICFSMMQEKQDKAGITADQLTGWLRHDIDTALSNDDSGTTCIMRAAYALAQESGPWGGPGLWGSVPSCIDLVMTGWLAGPMSSFPHLIQVIQLDYLFDEFGPGRVPGVR